MGMSMLLAEASTTTAATTAAATAVSLADESVRDVAIFLALICLAALAGAWALGVFSRQSLDAAPPRVEDPRSVPQLWLIGACGFLAAFLLMAVAQGLGAQIGLGLRQRLGILITIYLLVSLGVLLAHRSLRTGLLLPLGLGARAARFAPVGLLALLIALPWVFFASLLTRLALRALDLDAPPAHALLLQMAAAPDAVAVALMIVMAVLLAPVFEELIFRVHLQSALLGFSRNRWFAICLSSLVFAVIHERWMIPPIFVLAVCIGYVYERTGSFWAALAMHMGFNGLNTAFFLYSLTSSAQAD